MEQGGLDTALDFMLEVNAGIAGNSPPSCALSGQSVNNVPVGQPFSISMTGTDPDGDNLTLQHQGLPGGATLTPTSGTTSASPFTGTFAWTPNQVGIVGVTFTFTDPLNQQAQCSITINTTNVKPTADAGPDQNNVGEATTVTLDGSGSSDPDGDPLTYTWLQVAGDAVGLNGANSVAPTFDAPYVSATQTLTFQLTVSDGQLSDTDTVDITIESTNSPPIAIAGPNSTIKEGATGQLDTCNDSYDPDGDTPLTYSWTQTGGPSVVLSPDANSCSPTFSTMVGDAGTLTFQLSVSDGKEPSLLIVDGTDGDSEVQINIVQNSQPVAEAGGAQTKNEGETVTLNGGNSYDPDTSDTLSYAWSQTGGSTVSLTGAATATPSFDAPPVQSGGETFTFQLVVTDDDPYNQLSSVPDTVVINVVNINDPPACHLATPSISALWPPNHKMKEISIENVSDSGAYNTVNIVVSGVTQDEPLNGLGDGDTSPDAVIGQDTTLIRSERSGGGNGRVYVINFTADDGFESCTGSVTTTVPHNRRGKGSVAVDDGQNYPSTAAP